MCGIAGFYSFGAPERQDMRRACKAMTDAIAHRGPDDSDVWQDPDVPLALGHRRLSIIDLSAGGHQPMASHTGRFVIVFNGEIYNYRSLQADLEAAGRAFQSRSDTEVMLGAFEQWGVNRTLQKLEGMFAFALWDRQERKLHLVRDRFGKKPLYVGWGKESLLFASELKAFHAHSDFTPEISRDVLALYMRYGYVCAPHCIFEGVWQLLPGARMTLDMESLPSRQDLKGRMEVYWYLPDIVEAAKAHPNVKPASECIEEFEEMFREATYQRMISDVPLGAFLSGGMNSSAVVAMMQSGSGQPVKTFSIGFEEAGYNEAVHAERIARHLGTQHREFYVTAQDALDVIPKLPDIYDEPFADPSQIPTYLISKLAREEVSVALTGDGGDEILGGYQRHTHIPAVWEKIGWMPYPLRRAAGALVRAVPAGVYDSLYAGYPQFGRRMHRLARLTGLKTPEDVYAYLVGAWPNPEEVVTGGKVPSIPLNEPAWQPQGLSFAERMMYGDTLSYRPNDLMVKSDRASMAVALELRAPLMDHKLCEYAWRLPHDMKVRGMNGKWLLRQVLKRHVPEELFERPKMGFGIPVSEWLRGPLKNWGAGLLDKKKLEDQGFLNAGIVGDAWEKHQKGVTVDANSMHLWSVLMFQAWYERWMVKGKK